MIINIFFQLFHYPKGVCISLNHINKIQNLLILLEVRSRKDNKDKVVRIIKKSDMTTN